MIDYESFYHYLVELVGQYRQKRTLSGMSKIAKKWHCTAITKEQFFRMKIDQLSPEQVTRPFSRTVRDIIGRYDAKAIISETVGRAVTEGGRVSQGSDGIIQITITPPTAGRQQKEPTAGIPPSPHAPSYKSGQVLYHRGNGETFLVSKLSDGDLLAYRYVKPCNEDTIRDVKEQTLRIGNSHLRPAKGNEVARFLGALTRCGYEWTADNANGLFFVKEKAARESVDVFANDLPYSNYPDTGIYPLASITPSPYRYAIGPLLPIDNAADYMTECYDTRLLNAVVRQVRGAFPLFDHIREMFEYDMPSLCCSEEVKEYRVAMVRDDNNGTAYWLAKDRDVLRLLSWVSFIV